jgi:hypothetical protein
MNLEDELKSALRRQEPSPGFAERVLSAARAPRPHRPTWRERFALPFPRARLYWATACVLACVLLIASGTEYRRRRQGELAKEQVVLAFRIAGEKLSFAQRKALSIGSAQAASAAEPDNTQERQ